MQVGDATPLGTGKISPETFKTELEAVWHASNYYYETSYNRNREFSGVVFRTSDGRFGYTVRGDGTHAAARVSVFDVPVGTLPTAVWHTHLPSERSPDIVTRLAAMYLGADPGLNEFSGPDKSIVDKSGASKVLKHAWGQQLSIYLTTRSLIKRYQGRHHGEKFWTKEPPRRMR
jgi:hypothetical protein